MGKFCEVCGKGKMSGNNVSHAENKTKRSWAPNVQRVHVIVDGKTQRKDSDHERLHALPPFRQDRPQRLSD